MTPFEVTVLSVTLNAAVIVPSGNNRFSPPNVTGSIISQKASTKSCFMSVCTRLALPDTCKSGAACCLVLGSCSGVYPFGEMDGGHACEVKVLKGTGCVG